MPVKHKCKSGISDDGKYESNYGLAERLRNEMNVLSFNYEGSFKSEGVFSWENCLTDVGAAISFL